MGRYDGKPGSVLVDMSLMQSAPDKKFPYLVITGPHAQDCNKQGIPATADIADLEDILDATTSFITGLTAKVLTGTFTHNCDRLNYYYVKDTTGIRGALGRMYGRSYKAYNYTIKIKHDPEWITYRTFLYPDSAATRWMGYSKMIAGMMAKGDSLVKARDIKFDLYFRTDTDRNAFATFAKGKGYRTDSMLISQSTVAPYEIIVSKNAMVKMETILASEDEMAEIVRKRRGFYYGWSAPLNSGSIK